jgi:formate dehydrogenase maturation protein FdhE
MQQELPLSKLEREVNEIVQSSSLVMDEQAILSLALERIQQEEAERRLPLDRAMLARLGIIQTLVDDLANQPEGSPIAGVVAELLQQTVISAIGSVEDAVIASEKMLRKGNAA